LLKLIGMGVLQKIGVTVLAIISPILLGAEASLLTSLGQNLSPEEPATSISFEPELKFNSSDKTAFTIYSLVNRPTDPYKNFEVPKAIFAVTQTVSVFDDVTTKLSAGVNLLSLDRWKAEGYTFRPSIGFIAEKEVARGLTIRGRLSPYAQFNRYTQTASGVTLPTFGLNERLTLLYTVGDFDFDAHLIFDQRHASVWVNDIATLESAAYNINSEMNVGLAHELVSGGIDSTTGFSRPIRFFHERESRISAFVKVRM
jgi:hypothetical protein